MHKRMTVKERVDQLVREHGSYALAGESIGMTRSRLWESATGKRGAGEVTLRALGLDPDSASFCLLTCSRNRGTK
jgi:hypothetical protein